MLGGFVSGEHLFLDSSSHEECAVLVQPDAAYGGIISADVVLRLAWCKRQVVGRDTVEILSYREGV